MQTNKEKNSEEGVIMPAPMSCRLKFKKLNKHTITMRRSNSPINSHDP